nr:aromatic amino acid lyase [Rhizobium bangladeshense]
MLAVGGSGISTPVFQALLDLLNARVHPLIQSIGSIGAGDLLLLFAVARCLVGEGKAEYAGAIHPAHEALRMAGLTPVTLR